MPTRLTAPHCARSGANAHDPRVGSIGDHSKHPHSRTAFIIVSLLSIFWLVFRTGTKPTRISYPCQRAALAQTEFFFFGGLLSFAGGLGALAKGGFTDAIANRKAFFMIVTLLVASVTTGLVFSKKDGVMPDRGNMALNWQNRLIEGTLGSDVFFVGNASGPNGSLDEGVKQLFDLMALHGDYFYQTVDYPSGFIASNDVVILKVNCQWDERGGTNTDLVRSLIKEIVDHPEGFVGEIVVADNGQGRGSLDWSQSNAFDKGQSIQNVVDEYSSSHKVSTYLWDTIGSIRVSEYDSGDMIDGYIVDSTPDAETGMRTSYPKFKTAFGTYISLANGVWDVNTRVFNSDGLKLINVPVLKTHGGFGVTGCIKHYMGVQSQPLSNGHSYIGQGGMGTEMAKTIFPALNLLDCIWVNPNPQRGPSTSYDEASYSNIIGASTDPVALDYIASKRILIQESKSRSYTDVSSLDPDNPNGIYHNYLQNSMNQLRAAGHEVTMNESEIGVWHESAFSSAPTNPGSSSADDQPSLWLYIVFGSICILAIVLGAVYVHSSRKRHLSGT